MTLPELPDFPSHVTPDGRGRHYVIDERTHLAAFHLEASLPHAPDGFIVYVFVQAGRVGRWDWTTDPAAIDRILKAFAATTSITYEPPDHLAPDGDPAQIRPALQDLLARVMEEARPGPLTVAASKLLHEGIVISIEGRRGLTLEPPDS